MKRSMCGFVILAAATTLWSCNGDPTGGFQEGERIQARPSSMFLNQGESKFVEVEMVDNQGNQLAADFEAQNVGAGLTVEKDTTFLRTTIGTNLETTERFIVTGTAPTASEFQLVSGGQTLTVPVKVTPVDLASITVSNPTPAANEVLTITLPAGYKFGAGAGANVAGDAGIVTGVAPDSSSLTMVLPPGTTGTITVDNVQVDYLPGVLLSLPTTQTVTVGAATPLAGTADPATAPALSLPAPGGATVVYDVPDFTATVNHFYRIDVVEAGDYAVTLDWDIGSDLDLILCNDAACSVPNFAAATGNHPESTTYTLVAGTQYILINDYAGDAAGATVSIVIER